MIEKLHRPSPPALPSSYFWTWDHSTNWMLDDPGMQTIGCYNPYLKRPETFLTDYQRLIDFSVALGVKGIVIWGFLRDAHGGIDAARRVAEYAAAKEIAIMPGIGTTDYGGVYYEGEHPYNLACFLRRYPEARMIDAEGRRKPNGICPTDPAFQDWIAEGMQWLFREFPLGGVNLENGDFLTCCCPRCRARIAEWPTADPAFFIAQALGVLPALHAIAGEMGQKLITWATYTGFLPGTPNNPVGEGSMQCDRPAIVDLAPESAITQWTLTNMVGRSGGDPARASLATYLDDGAPEAVLATARWPREVRPPSHRSVGFLHQGSQWTGNRYEMVISTIKEGCLRAHRAGLEGVTIHGEVTNRFIPWALNYLAFSHFIHWPEDTLRAFAHVTLGPVLGSAENGELFLELLAAAENNTLTQPQRDELWQRGQAAASNGIWPPDAQLEPWRFWNWLYLTACEPGQRAVNNLL